MSSKKGVIYKQRARRVVDGESLISLWSGLGLSAAAAAASPPSSTASHTLLIFPLHTTARLVNGLASTMIVG